MLKKKSLIVTIQITIMAINIVRQVLNEAKDKTLTQWVDYVVCFGYINSSPNINIRAFCYLLIFAYYAFNCSSNFCNYSTVYFIIRFCITF
jgi:hypothetical protein